MPRLACATAVIALLVAGIGCGDQSDDDSPRAAAEAAIGTDLQQLIERAPGDAQVKVTEVSCKEPSDGIARCTAGLRGASSDTLKLRVRIGDARYAWTAGAQTLADVAVPGNAVALVGATDVSVADYERALAVAKAGDPKARRAPKAASRNRKDALAFLLQAAWLTQEAEARDVSVSDAAVRKVFERQREQAFDSRGAYRRYLKRSGLSEDDLLVRVRLDELQAALVGKVTRGSASREKAIAAFTRRFRKKWKPRTLCARSYGFARECGDDGDGAGLRGKGPLPDGGA